MKRSFFQVAVVSILLYGCTTCTLTKRLEKKLGGNYTRMLRAILNKSWRQHPTKHQLYGHLPPITKTIQGRQTRHAGHCWRSRDELIRDALRWTPTYGRAKAGWPAWTYIQQLCEDTGCSPEDLPEAMNDREKWRERVRDIHASGMTWWWWYIYPQGLEKIKETPGIFRKDLFRYGFLIAAIPCSPALCNSLLKGFEEAGFWKWSLSFTVIFGAVFLWSFQTIHVRVRQSLSDSFRFLPEFCFNDKVFPFSNAAITLRLLARPNNSAIFVTLVPSIRAPTIWTLFKI